MFIIIDDTESINPVYITSINIKPVTGKGGINAGYALFINTQGGFDIMALRGSKRDLTALRIELIYHCTMLHSMSGDGRQCAPFDVSNWVEENTGENILTC